MPPRAPRLRNVATVVVAALLVTSGMAVGSVPAQAENPDFQLLAEIPLPNSAAGEIHVPLAIVGSTVYVADDSRIYTMDVHGLALDDTLTLPANAGTMTPMAAVALGDKVFFAYRTRQVVALDVGTRAITVLPAVCGTGGLISPWLTTHGNRVYVGCASASFVARVDPVSLTLDDTFPTGGTNRAMAVVDDTAYVVSENWNSTTQVDLRADPPTASPGPGSTVRAFGIVAFDDTLYIADRMVTSLSVVNVSSVPPISSTLFIPMRGLAIDTCESGVYVIRSGFGSPFVTFVNPYTQAVETIGSGAGRDPTALDSYAGQLWVLTATDRGVTTIDCSTRAVDDSVTFSVAAGAGRAMAFSPGRTFVTTAGGANGYLAVIQTAAPPTPPAPAPPIPASAPVAPVGRAGDASAIVSWSAPASSGSYPVTHYLATSSPDGRSCLVAAPALTCEVGGLTNGTAYTFTVRALTGAGWSAASDPSNAVTPEAAPRPSVMITGSRQGDRIEVFGQTTGLGMGGTLRPWLRFPGQSAYSEGSATILVSMDGIFEWGRRTGKRASVYVQTPDGSVRSNVIVIAAR